MNLSSDNYRDIQKYYKDCFVKYPEEAGDKLFYVQKVGPNEIRGTHFNIETGEEDPYVFHMEEETKEGFVAVNAEFLLPKKSYFMHNGFACLLYRKPLRQYRRGICEDNTAIMSLNGSGSFDALSVDWLTLQSYVDKKAYTGFDLSRTQQSYAISPRMAVCRAGLIFVDKTRIGSFSVKEQRITLKHAMFLPEIQAVLNVHKQDIKVVVGTEEE